MPRAYEHHLADLVEAAEKIQLYLGDMNFEEFSHDPKTIDAVIRNLEVIGEAAKKIPDEVKKSAPEIEWKKVCGIRDILIHEYFAVDLSIVWSVIQEKIPRPLISVKRIIPT